MLVSGVQSHETGESFELPHSLRRAAAAEVPHTWLGPAVYMRIDLAVHHDKPSVEVD